MKKVLIVSVNASAALKSTEYYNLNGTYFQTVSFDKEARNKLIYSIYLGSNLYASYNRPYDLENNLTYTDSLFYFFTINKGPAASNLLYYGADGGVVDRNFIYNTNSGKLVALERISPDSSTYYLPFMEPHVVSFKGVNYADGYFYAHISSLKMFQSVDATTFKNPQYPPSLKSYFTTQDRKSNPVIVKMKLKK